LSCDARAAVGQTGSEDLGNDRNSEGGGCFGCSGANIRGLQLEFRASGTGVEAATTLDGSLAGFEGLVHGGIVATLLDEAMGWAIREEVGRYAVTRTLDVRFRRPVAVGRPLRVVASVENVDAAGQLHVESRVLDARGRLLASAHGVWVPVRDRRAVAPGAVG